VVTSVGAALVGRGSSSNSSGASGPALVGTVAAVGDVVGVRENGLPGLSSVSRHAADASRSRELRRSVVRIAISIA
jgi:hypothetical protein